jgi:RND family efflux transporter MFP subunit
MLVLLAAVIVVAVVALGIISRSAAETALTTTTNRAAVPVVNVVEVAPGKSSSELMLPGNTQAFNEAPIYARTNGYIKKWYADIGQHVRQGELLAEIETPEVDQQLDQAKADLRTAEANLELATSTAQRWKDLLKDDAVSKQETDQAVSDFNARRSARDSAQANVHRLQQLQSFEKVYAPFTGVVTARNTDIGSLIDAGSASPKELFHVAAISKLRIYVMVPEADSAVAANGTKVGITLDEYPGETFTGTIVRNADSIDQATRTLRVEVDIDNPQDRIKTGAYVQVHFPALQRKGSVAGGLLLPANTLLFRSEGLRVAVVKDGKAQLVPVQIGRDYGSNVEVVAGVKAGDHVIANPSDSLISGTEVRIASNKDGDNPR